MQRASVCRRRSSPSPSPPPPPSPVVSNRGPSSRGSPNSCRSSAPPKLLPFRLRGLPWATLLLFVLAFWGRSCKGAPVEPHVLQGEDSTQLWNEIEDACSIYLAKDSSPQSSNALEELCFMILELLQKLQDLDEKDNTKRSSVLHPLLQLVPQLHEKRMKRYKMDEELRIPGGVQSRGYFIFRPRNGRRSASFH